SAALLAHLELLDLDDARRNRICTPVPHPEHVLDLASALVTTSQNMLNSNRHMALWLRRTRLFLGHHAPAHRYLLGSGRLAMIQRRAAASMRRMQSAAPAESGAARCETVGAGA
nr:hypothetical protein [Solirubrobacteraceae bacterium]